MTASLSAHNQSSLETLTGMVEHVTFQSEDSGFSVLKVKANGHRELVTVVGVTPPVTAGEWIEAGGRWVLDTKFGQQFKLESIKTTRPDTLEGIERYLGSGLIKGIGPHFAIPEHVISNAIDHALGEKRLIARPELGDSDLLYLASLDTAEAMLTRNLLALAKGNHP